MLNSRPISRNGEGTQRFGAKTPARGLQNENAIRNAPTTLGKGNLKASIPQTPLQSKSIKGDIQLKDVPRAGKGDPPIQLNTISRPFLDKTPFPNRVVSIHTQTPFNRDLSETPDSPQIPSSTRKHIRLPKQSQKFETPLNTKHHWDLSDDEVEIAAPVAPPRVLEVKEDYDEVEYMPPNTLDLPYQPPLDFQLPDYREVGKVLMGFSRNLVLDEPQPPPEIAPRAEDIAPIPWNMIPLPELEDDDPFDASRKKNPPPTRTTQSTMRNSSKPVPVPRTTHIPPTSTTRPNTSSSVIRPNSRTRVASVSTHNTRTALKPVMAMGRSPSKLSGDVTVKPKAVPVRRPATSASTHKSALPPVRGRPGASKPSTTTGPLSYRRQVVATKSINTKTEDELDVISLKADLLKHDENEDFLFDV
ncbi:hypothetical protein E1B28_002376 [Marasmius oreades]|uniref:Uncharacterized protein n=1 Tax=Marasmius oreades TaxID=181124 RepID=A0A9P7RN80_9AGAR|nr:uncharacterized protein E1B28_002376 [Marasmius oreades]KAG7086422.1 hypothetical protein E1B28_002376 [Marasmius oreades]